LFCHHFILFFRVTTFTVEDLSIVPSKTFLYTEENPHQGSKRMYM